MQIINFDFVILQKSYLHQLFMQKLSFTWYPNVPQTLHEDYPGAQHQSDYFLLKESVIALTVIITFCHRIFCYFKLINYRKYSINRPLLINRPSRISAPGSEVKNFISAPLD